MRIFLRRTPAIQFARICFSLTVLIVSSGVYGLYSQGLAQGGRPGEPAAAEEPTPGQPRAVFNEFLKGIARGNVKSPGWNEYLPAGAMELPQIVPPFRDFHPRLLPEVSLNRAQEMRHRLPYNNWYRKIKRHADENLATPPSAIPFPRQTELLKYYAFLFHLDGNTAYLEKAIQLLENVPPPPQIVGLEGGPSNRGWGDYLQSALALPPLYLALDLLHSHLGSGLLTDVRQKALSVTGQIKAGLRYSTFNNHKIAIAVALMTVALAEDSPRDFIPFSNRELWLSGLQALSEGLTLVAPDGGYGEGVYYARFILETLAPFSVYLENATGSRLFSNPYLERMVDWVNANYKGSGFYSALDDAYQPQFFYLPVILPQSRQAAAWNAHWESLPPVPEADPNMVEALCAYADQPTLPENPTAGSQFFMDSGQLILRDSPINPRLFASFIAERPAYFSDRHEHIDPLSFELSAFGEDFIIEGGYGTGVSDPNRDWYISPLAHNGILIDGRGTYRNPFFGDSLGAAMVHCFQTPGLTAATLTQEISDVSLARTVQFIDNGVIFLLDAVYSPAAVHEVALNMNYSGQLIQKNAQQLIIEKETANLHILSLTDSPESATLQRDFGLYTPAGAPRSSGRFQLARDIARNGIFLTLFIPAQKSGGAEPAFSPVPVNGEGEVWEIAAGEFSARRLEVGILRGAAVQTGSYQTDARAFWVQFDAAERLIGCYLHEVTQFQTTEFSLAAERPVSIYLEKEDGQWLGYVGISGKRAASKLTLRGFSGAPVFFRYQPVQFAAGQGSPGSHVIIVADSGPLEIGAGPHRVSLPYRVHPAHNFLSWLRRQWAVQPPYEYWPDYQKQLFRNQVLQYAAQGVRRVIRNWSQQWFGWPEFLTRSANLAMGLSQESYNNQSLQTIRLPHRYDWDGKSAGQQWEISEEGLFTERQIQVRFFQVRFGAAESRRFQYRLNRWFEGHASHDIRMAPFPDHEFSFHSAQLNGRDENYFGWRWGIPQGFLKPGFYWSQAAHTRQFLLGANFPNAEGNLSFSSRNGQWDAYQSLRVAVASSALSIEAEQTSRENRQRYVLSGNTRRGASTHLSGAVRWEPKTSEPVPFAFAQLMANPSGQFFRLRLEKFQRNLFQKVAIGVSTASHFLSAFLNMENFRFGKRSVLNMDWEFQPSEKLSLQSAGEYGFDEETRAYRANLFHNASIRLNSRHFIQLLSSERFPSSRPWGWLGAGWGTLGARSLYGQILTDISEPFRSLNYQLSLTVPELFRSSGLKLWLNGIQRSGRLQRIEIRLQQLQGSRWSPGMYYAYLRGGGIRWEGFLQWQW